MKENLKYWTETTTIKILYVFIAHFVHLGAFIAMLLRGNVHVYLECTNTRSPEFGTVLHWQPPDVHIFHTDPSLLLSKSLVT